MTSSEKTTGDTIVLTQEQERRYQKQLALPGMSQQAQERLLTGNVLILGIESNGAIAAQYLVDAGLGSITLVDRDPKALAVLYRQICETPHGNPDAQVTCKAVKFSADNAETLFGEHDVVIDGLHDWQDKLIASDVAMHLGKPLIHAGGSGFRFQLFNMQPGKSACLRCAFPMAGIDDVPLLPVEGGQLSPVVGMVGAWQALEAIKLIARLGASQGNELTKVDWLSGESEIIRGLDPRDDCPDCKRKNR
ncbi:MAG TPA: ThiF family adenylyltransferase [Chroococcales cyanobacterium]